ncbi:MAG: DNA/RNA nuclease SfsA, partial [Desulfobacterales bacterium]|nr:DNA/RNA nuclease SfsA [Candidatus Bathyarchaeota archaeon]NIR17439.1 DNA/RNA nuclease SfsA [Desulfobacterales bacterium]
MFLERPNRFLTLVKVQDEILECYLPNSGRMRTLLTPGVEGILKEVVRKDRKTNYD